jgi:regulator of replication initiation timing
MSKNNLKEENKQLKSENEALKAKLGEFKNVTDPGKV